MMESILFSICIPNYNYSRFIKATIQSVLDQDYHNFEIIVSDNASTDDSEEVVLAFGDPRIKFLRNKYNIGFSPNLDKATATAKGDYILLLSSDDLMKPGALSCYAELINRYQERGRELVLMSATDVIDEKGNITGYKKAQTGDVINYYSGLNHHIDLEAEMNLLDGRDVLKGLISGTFQPAGQFLTTCFSRKLYQEVGGYNTPMSLYPDAFFSHKLLSKNPVVVYVNRPFFAYRVHSNNNLASINKLANIKHLVDNYLLSLSFSRELLQDLELTDASAKKSFISNVILKPALYSVLGGQAGKALRLLAFGYASFPGLILSQPSFYTTILLSPLTPLFRLGNFLHSRIKQPTR
jgi:glycosyltransferase involved in cell wall biosynthesis